MDINVVCLLEKIPDRVPSLPGISLIPVINIFLSLEERWGPSLSDGGLLRFRPAFPSTVSWITG
ncbi:hypothetical protein, partial [Akkermansia muciniphila]|uniref:hypothetical protein n=1 Tax=Akkermansia muciniphila TaxID=239935 RepID=UPI001C9B613F